MNIIDEMWKWIDRDLDDEFFDTKIIDKREGQERWNEIPEILKPLAYIIITLACRNVETMGEGGPCLYFRCQLFSVAKDLEKKGVDIHLPHRWFVDGPMIEPEWIVRITNGLVKWNCKPNYDNPDTCGLEMCRYRRVVPLVATSPLTEEPRLCPTCNGAGFDFDGGVRCHSCDGKGVLIAGGPTSIISQNLEKYEYPRPATQPCGHPLTHRHAIDGPPDGPLTWRCDTCNHTYEEPREGK